MRNVNLKEVLNGGGVYLDGSCTGLDMEEIILRVAKKAEPHLAANGFMTPVRVPGVYPIWAVGTSGDVTVLVWHHGESEFTVKAVCW